MDPPPENTPATGNRERMPSIEISKDARTSQVWAGIGVYVALAWTYLIFLPGITGGFLFDDFSNLGPLERLNSDPTFNEVIQFLVHGISSPSGRPISLATFALQAGDWPLNPGGFIRVNVLLHLLNGALLFWWFLILARLMQLPSQASLFVPLASALLWLIAPIQVTAVLYVVQRMTELSATFIFSGLILYLTGRRLGASGADRAALVWMSLGVFWGAGVGVLAKENAVLMPLLILALEFTVLAGIPRPRAWRPWSAVFLLLPIVLLVGYVLLKADVMTQGYALREFTLGQRLLTETRVLFMYLHKLFLPWPSAIQLLYDDFPLSANLVQPATTLASVLGLAGLVTVAWRFRTVVPCLAFAVFWFLSAHLLESSVLPLEPVFEHRNYQAAAGVWFALVAGIWGAGTRAPGRLIRPLLAVLAVAYVGSVSAVTWQVAGLWGRPFEMAAWWAELQPESRRARLEFLGAVVARGYLDEGVKIATVGSEKWPNDPLFHLNLIQIQCLRPTAPPPLDPDLIVRLRTARAEILSTVNQLDALMTAVETGSCPNLPPATVRTLGEAALDNPHMQVQRQNLLLLRARALRREGRRDESRQVYREAVELKPVMILLFQGILDELDSRQVSARQLQEARELFHLAEADPRISALDRWSHREDIEGLRQLLELYAAPQPLP